MLAGTLLGHAGGILLYATLVAASEDGGRVAVISIHGDIPRGSARRERAALRTGLIDRGLDVFRVLSEHHFLSK